MRRAIGGRGEQFEDLRAGVDGIEGFAGGGKAGHHGQPARHRVADQRRLGIGGDDETRADPGQRVDVFVAQHGAGADPGARAVALLRQGNALGPARRVERDLDRVESGVDQGTDMRQRVFRGDATQDGDQRQGERVEHGVVDAVIGLLALERNTAIDGQAALDVGGRARLRDRAGQAVRVADPGTAAAARRGARYGWPARQLPQARAQAGCLRLAGKMASSSSSSAVMASACCRHLAGNHDCSGRAREVGALLRRSIASRGEICAANEIFGIFYSSDEYTSATAPHGKFRYSLVQRSPAQDPPAVVVVASASNSARSCVRPRPPA